jgi:hypothetical protein
MIPQPRSFMGGRLGGHPPRFKRNISHMGPIGPIRRLTKMV